MWFGSLQVRQSQPLKPKVARWDNSQKPHHFCAPVPRMTFQSSKEAARFRHGSLALRRSFHVGGREIMPSCSLEADVS